MTSDPLIGSANIYIEKRLDSPAVLLNSSKISLCLCCPFIFYWYVHHILAAALRNPSLFSSHKCRWRMRLWRCCDSVNNIISRLFRSSSPPSWPWLHPSPLSLFYVLFPSFLLHAALHSAPPIVLPPRSLQLKWSVTMWRSVLKACLYGRDLDSLSPLKWGVADIQSAGRISFRHLFTLDTCHAEMAAY